MSQFYYEATIVFPQSAWENVLKYGLPAKPENQTFHIEQKYLNAVQRMDKVSKLILFL